VSVKRRRVLQAVALAPSLVVARPASAVPPAAGGTVRIIGPWELSSIDPLRNGYLFSRMEVTETLVECDADGRPRPGLAAGWSVSPDRLTWRFVLAGDARFHDGAPVRAADVVAALQRARHAAGVLSQAPIADIAADADALRIRLERPFSPLLALLSHSTTQVLAPSSFGPDGNVRTVVGSGPYRVVELEPPQRFAVEAFEHWRGPRPAIRRAAYLSVGRAEMRALMAQGGQADLAYGLDPGSITRLARKPSVRLHGVTIPRTTSLKVNAGHPWLSDLDTRRALSLALDRRGIATAILRDPDLAAGQLFPPALAGWHDAALPALGYGPEQARSLLMGAGWTPGHDGILTRGNARFALTLRTFPDRPELPVIATAIQEQLRRVGIEVRVSIGNSSDIPFAHRDGSLEMALIARNYGVVPDAFGTIAQDFAGSGGDWGAMGWASPAVARALAALPRVSDPRQAAPLRQDVARSLHHDLPLIPVLWYRQTLAANPRLNGVSIDPYERSYRLTQMQWQS
jgi:peptide/nickel transport system substrate-binding protein